MKRLGQWFAISLMTMSVSGCVTSTNAKSDACSLLKPITFSERDTIETQDQIVDYLITYEALCEGK